MSDGVTGPGGPPDDEAPAGASPEHALRRLELTIVRRLDGLLQGGHQGLLPGPGSEPGDSRMYVPGEDDVRRMDWAVTARTTVPHVRDLVADRELETWALADLSASMDFGTADLEKRDLVIAAVGSIGFLASRIGDRFGAYALHAGQVHRFPARPGRPSLYALLRALAAAPRGVPGGDDTSLAEGIEALSRARRRAGMRVVVSDFLDPVDPAYPEAERPWERPIRRLAARHQVLAVEVLDPRELELPGIGRVTLTDPETGRTADVFLNRRIRADYARAAALQRESTRVALRRCGVAHLVLRTDEDWVFAIAQFVLRQRRIAHVVRRASAAGQAGRAGA